LSKELKGRTDAVLGKEEKGDEVISRKENHFKENGD